MLQSNGDSCFLLSRNLPLRRARCSVPWIPLGAVAPWTPPGNAAPWTPQSCITSISTRKNLPGNVKCHVRAGIEGYESSNRLNSSSNNGAKLKAFYNFSRPHTIIGTVIGITSVCLLPLESVTDLSPAFFVGLLKALIPSLAMNIYAVGLNQVYDVEIDKVNKPYLPLASGEFSMKFAIAIVTLSLFTSLGMGFMSQSPPLLSALLISFLLTSVYSVKMPLLRWKSYPFLAATIILVVRAILVQVCFFLHIQKYVFGRRVVFTKSLLFGISFMSIFSTVIALFKDVPDVDGDRKFGIQSFSITLGQERVFWLCVSMLMVGYVSAVTIGLSSSYMLSKFVTVVGHSLLAFVLLFKAQSVALTDKDSMTSFYMFIWKLFYAEYFLIPFVR